jgi:WD40 repeat protein
MGMRYACWTILGVFVMIAAAHAQTPQAGPERLAFEGHTGPVYNVAFSSDGKQIVSGSADMTAKVWDAQTGKETVTLKGHTGKVNSVAFRADGRVIVSASDDKTVRVWDVQTGKEISILKKHTGPVNSAAISSDGQRIVSGSSDGTAKVWNTQTGQEILSFVPLSVTVGTGGGKFEAQPGQVNSVAFSPDGTRILIGASALRSFGNVTVWETQTGQKVLELKEHTGPVHCVGYSFDGQRIVIGGENSLKVRDAQTGQETLTIKGHNGAVRSVAYSPDGKRIVSGSRRDDDLKLWDARTGQEVAIRKGYTGHGESAAFSPDNQRIVSSWGGNAFKVWDVTSLEEKKPVDTAEKRERAAPHGRVAKSVELLKRLGEGDPTAWTVLGGMLVPAVAAVIVGMYLKRKQKKPETPEELIDIAEKRRGMRFLAIPVIVVPFLGGVAIDLGSTSTPIGIMLGLGIGIFFGMLILFLNGDCPACGKTLGRTWNPKHCPNCGAQLRKE